MFESVRSDDAAARIRSAAVPPLAAFLVALAYLTIYPMLTRVPPALFWSVVLVLASGALLGAIAIIREVRRERVRGRAFGWLVAAAAMELMCAWLTVGLVFPWV